MLAENPGWLLIEKAGRLTPLDDREASIRVWGCPAKRKGKIAKTTLNVEIQALRIQIEMKRIH
jgi:hypothetical protein